MFVTLYNILIRFEKVLSMHDLRIHLHKNGSGMAAKTACGRNILRTQLATDWLQFRELPDDQQCLKCAASKQALFNQKRYSKLLLDLGKQYVT